MKLLLRISRLSARREISLWKGLCARSETSRVLRIIQKRVLFLSFSFSVLSLLYSLCYILLHYVYLIFLFLFCFFIPLSICFPFFLLILAFLLLHPCGIIMLLFQRGFFANARRSTKIDPWRIMNESSRIAVLTKGTNMIVYHRVCACMCVCMWSCACMCLDVCLLDRIFLDPAF